MVPETLSRQTRQTRLALLLLSTAAICLWWFGGEIVVDKGVSLFGASVMLSEVALHTTFFALILYTLVSFFISSWSDKEYAGTSPSEQDISGKISRWKDSKAELEKSSRIETIRSILKYQEDYERNFSAVNKIYDAAPLNERHADLFDRAYRVSCSDDEYRIVKLAELLPELDMIQHSMLITQPVIQQYESSMAKSGTAILNSLTLTDQQKQVRLDQDRQSISSKHKQASDCCDALGRASCELKSMIETELNINTAHKRRLLSLENDMERAEKRRRLNLKPSFSAAYFDYILLELGFPLLWGVFGLIAGGILFVRSLNGADVSAVVHFLF